MERRRRLTDRLAIAAGELLAHRLDHLPPARDHLQRLGHVLAQLGQPAAAAAQAVGRRRDDHALALDVVRKGLAQRPPALAGARGLGLCRRRLGSEFVLRRGRLELLQRSEEHTSELQSLMRISYAVFCLKKKTKNTQKK